MTEIYPLATALASEARRIRKTLIPLVDRFRARQSDDGTVPGPTETERDLLLAIRDRALAWYRSAGLEAQAEALEADVDDWLARGLDTAPDFARSRDALAAPADGEPARFLAPIQTTNSAPPVGKRLECLFVLHREPDALTRLAVDFPHPKNNCQTTILLAGSTGFSEGNCLVFFPENVAAADKIRDQAYAMFLFSKFRRIHETYALPSAEAVLTEESLPRASTGMSANDCYEARSIWGYLHDRCHYQGPWPIDEHISLKMNWFVGLLEEIKVDANTVLACAHRGVPHGEEQTAMILLERVCRYPLAADAVRNFDSGTGVFLYSWLRAHGALTDASDGRLHLDREAVLAALSEYVDTIEALEKSARTAEEYKAEAKALVRRHLQPGAAKGERYAFTDDQRILLRAKDRLDRLPPLRYAPAEW